ncbi:MAG: hypothetical protein PHE52_00945 [Candidatus Pacebacteria bacterium]|nr:hypothetical protein [Candidatus Paceibacterota bacterium]
MTKKTRRIIFLTLLALFLLIAPAAILYSQGYRIDLENRKVTNTGGLFLKIIPKQAEVYLNGTLEKKTDFFFGSILIENLLPRKYQIEIKKDGFYSWQKNLEIKEREVTEAKNIVLFPQTINFDVINQGTESFWFSPDQKKIILKEKEQLGWALKLYELDKKIKSRLIGETDISLKEADLMNLTFSDDSKKAYLEVGTREQIKNFTLEIDKTPAVLTETEPTPPPVEDSLAYKEMNNNDVYYLDETGFLFKNGEIITSDPFPVKQETEYSLEVFANYIFLKESDNLYLFNPESKNFDNFAGGVNILKVSPDLKKLAYVSNNEIWILFLADTYDQPAKSAGEKVFLVRLSDKINDLFWITSDHLVFSAGNKIKISEIDNRDGINIVEIAETKTPEIFWSESEKRLYILTESILYGSQGLLP